MRNLIHCSFLAAVLALGCKAQPTFEKAEPNRTLLWQITGGQLKQPSYVFGTMHILCPDDAKLSKTMQAIVADVKTVYFEIDMDDMVGMFGAMNSMKMLNDTKLTDLLSLDEYEKVSQYFSSHSKLPFSTVENYKPMLLSSMLIEQMMPCKAANGMEISILNEANRYKKDIQGLETLAFQSGLFDSIPYEEQAQELLKSIDSLPQQKQVFDKMFAAYRLQDLTALDGLMNSADAGLETQYLDLLLYSRNRNWVAKFDGIASDGPILIAVGAGHLPGSNGVLALLRAKGYTVEPIKN
jgi:uncharacterized protein YbaP (TraB family)